MGNARSGRAPLKAAAFALVCMLTPAQAEVPAGAVVRPPDISRVTMTGRLGARHQANIAYLLWQRMTYDMLKDYRNKFKEEGYLWGGEYAGKWLESASLTFANTGHDSLKKSADAFAAEYLTYQSPDGYLGIHELNRGDMWDMWNQWYTLAGFMGYFEATGAGTFRDASKRGCDYIVSTYSPITGPESKFVYGAYDGGLYTSCVDQIMRVHAHTADTALRAFSCSAMLYSPIISYIRQNKTVRQMHCYPLTATMGADVLVSAAVADRQELSLLEGAWLAMKERHQYPVGGFGFDEKLESWSPCDSSDAPLQETCATAEWLRLTYRLYMATGNIRYAHEIEHVVYNGLLGAQSADGMKWTYFTPLRYRKNWMMGPTACCFWSGSRGVAMIPLFVYATDSLGVLVNLLEPGSARLTVKGQDVRIDQTTTYPADGTTQVSVTPAAPLAFALRVRVPPWAGSPQATLNGTTLPPPSPGGYLVINRTWNAGDRVELRFDLAARQVVFRSYASSAKGASASLNRGPEVLSIDRRDNPGLDLDRVTLPQSVSLTPASLAGVRRRYSGAVEVQGTTQTVLFTPFADAGTDTARYRTVFPTRMDPAGTGVRPRKPGSSAGAYVTDLESRGARVFGIDGRRIRPMGSTARAPGVVIVSSRGKVRRSGVSLLTWTR